MTRSKSLISRIRSLCHEATQAAEASPLIVAALELAGEHEILIAQALAMEEVIHQSAKELDEAIERARRVEA